MKNVGVFIISSVTDFYDCLRLRPLIGENWIFKKHSAGTREDLIQSRSTPRNDKEGLAPNYSGYAFSKAHSTAYAMITYQTAFFKTHFKTEFVATQADNARNSVS